MHHSISVPLQTQNLPPSHHSLPHLYGRISRMSISGLNCSWVFLLFCSFHLFCLIRVIAYTKLIIFISLWIARKIPALSFSLFLTKSGNCCLLLFQQKSYDSHVCLLSILYNNGQFFVLLWFFLCVLLIDWQFVFCRYLSVGWRFERSHFRSRCDRRNTTVLYCTSSVSGYIACLDKVPKEEECSPVHEQNIDHY